MIGIKLVYSGGYSAIIRGTAKMSKKKDFYNQVTFTIKMNSNISEEQSTFLTSCKIFQNGTLHITGAHSMDEIMRVSNFLIYKLRQLKGVKMIRMRPNLNYLISFDNLIYNTTGDIIGWENLNRKMININGEYVMTETIDKNEKNEKIYTFVSTKWTREKLDMKKNIYSMNGDLIGYKQLEFYDDQKRHHYEVKFGYIYSGYRIIGKEHIIWCEICNNKIQQQENLKYFLAKGAILHKFTSTSTFTDQLSDLILFEESDFCIHMINTFFRAPFKICRSRLQKIFLENGYYSRFDPSSNAAVNLRYHYNNNTLNIGKCEQMFSLHPNSGKCQCKIISVSCFSSGKMNITGLSELKQGQIVYEFVNDFFLKHQKEICYTPI